MKIKSSKFCDSDVARLWERMAGEIEMLLNNAWKIIAVSTTISGYGDGRYNGVIFYGREE